MVKEEFKNAGRIAHADGMEPEQSRKVFIGGLAGSTDEESLRNFYGQWGEIVDCVVMRDPQTKRSRGFGFVSYATMAEVDVAMGNRPHDIDGKRVDPKRAIPREDSSRGQKLPTTNRLYISGIRDGHTEENLREYFTQYGNVEKVEVMLDKATNKPRGFAFINFDDYDPVDRCVLLKSHTIGGFRCDVKKGLSKEEMQTQGGRDRSARGERAGGPPSGGGRGASGRGGRGGWGGNDGGRGGWGAGGDAGGGQRGWGGPGAGAAGGWGAGGNRGGGAGGWGAGGGWNSQPDGGYGGSSGNWGAAPSARPTRYEPPSPWAANPQQAAPSGYSSSGYGASASGYGDYSASGYGASGSSGYGTGQSNSGSGGYSGYGGASSSWGQPDPWRR
ncbi:unnamed protein product, partial [Mesorhabditis belari]|uniref:RRM domain-containing protein n=1 Tax=Mesorhabditis belari TaxID=2138241 RepID=A0AAF3EY88_9BILA